MSPQAIHYKEAMFVTVAGLFVNLARALILGGAHGHAFTSCHSLVFLGVIAVVMHAIVLGLLVTGP